MRYVSRQGAAGWQSHHEHVDVPLRPGDAAELLVFGSGLVVGTVLALVALWRLLTLALVLGGG